MLTGSATPHRLPDLKPEEMSPAQRAAAKDMLSGPRKSLHGPFHAWLRSPEAATRLARLGEYLRYQSPLPRDVQELAILMTAKHCSSAYEWQAHRVHALAAGLSEETVAALERGVRPDGLTPSLAATYACCEELLRQNRVADSTYAAAVAEIDEGGVIDLIALIGLYITVAMTLSVAGVPLPDRAH